jgi:hypothetical protein
MAAALDLYNSMIASYNATRLGYLAALEAAAADLSSAYATWNSNWATWITENAGLSSAGLVAFGSSLLTYYEYGGVDAARLALTGLYDAQYTAKVVDANAWYSQAMSDCYDQHAFNSPS